MLASFSPLLFTFISNLVNALSIKSVFHEINMSRINEASNGEQLLIKVFQLILLTHTNELSVFHPILKNMPDDVGEKKPSRFYELAYYSRNSLYVLAIKIIRK